MALALLLAFQAAAELAPPATVPVDFDLAKVRPADDDAERARACARDDSSEIVVCGRRRRGNDYPTEEMERRYREKPLVAEVGIAPNASVRAYGESVEMPGGQISKRAMVGVKLRF
nr:hypothetical protein [uncultured Sphingosinicella sp.]